MKSQQVGINQEFGCFIIKSFSVIVFFLQGHRSFAQSNETPITAWLLPGMTYRHSPNLKFTGQYGYNTLLSVHAFYPQAFIKVGKIVTLNPAYLYLHFPSANGRRIQEHTLMNAVVLTFPLSKFLIEDRNLIWNRFRKNAEDIHFYRNRFRVFYPVDKSKYNLRVYLFDEPWFFINEHNWTRNRIAIGFTADIVRWFNVDISYVKENDKYNGSTNIFFIQGTTLLDHKSRRSTRKPL